MSFVPTSFTDSCSGVSGVVADAQDFGIIKVDDQGIVEIYNRWESDMAGIPPDQALGKNFFTQVAPCTNNRLVYGKFKEGVASGNLDEEFKYTFTYKMKPTNVTLRLYRDSASGTNWIFVTKN